MKKSVIVAVFLVMMTVVNSAFLFGQNTYSMDFETDADGNNIVHGQQMNDAYIGWGITFEGEYWGTSFDRTVAGYGPYFPADGVDYDGKVLIAPKWGLDYNFDGIYDALSLGNNGGYIDINYAADMASGSISLLIGEDMENGSIKFYKDGQQIVGQTVYLPDLDDGGVRTYTFDGFVFDQIRVAYDEPLAIAQLSTVDIPEPRTYLILGTGVFLAVLGKRRRARKALVS